MARIVSAVVGQFEILRSSGVSGTGHRAGMTFIEGARGTDLGLRCSAHRTRAFAAEISLTPDDKYDQGRD